MAEIGSVGRLSSVDQLIQQTLATERRPISDLEGSKSNLRGRLNILNDLKSKLRSLRDNADDFTKTGSLNNLNAKRAVSSNDEFFEITASGSAAEGTHTLKVNRLASVDTGVSKQFSHDGGTLASNSPGLQEFSIAVGDGEAINISVTIEASDTNEQVLQKVRDAINNSDTEVSASIVNDTANTARLVLRSKTTGSENRIELVELNGSNILRKLKYLNAGGNRRQADGTAGGFLLQDVTQLDASITLDGIDILKSKNEITDILAGVTIDLNKAQQNDDTALTFSIEADTESAKSEIEKFIEEYNSVIKYLNEKTKVDTDTFERGPLAGDFVFNNLKFSIRSLVISPISGLPEGSSVQFLSQIGIETNRDGTLTIGDRAKFDEKIAGDLEGIANIFTAEDGIGARLEGLLDKFVDSGGTVDRSKKSVDRQIKSIDVRIQNLETRLDLRAESLRREFTQLQKTLSLLNSQQSILSSSFGGFFQQGF